MGHEQFVTTISHDRRLNPQPAEEVLASADTDARSPRRAHHKIDHPRHALRMSRCPCSHRHAVTGDTLDRSWLHRIDTDYAPSGLTEFATFWAGNPRVGSWEASGRTARDPRQPTGAMTGQPVSSGRGIHLSPDKDHPIRKLPHWTVVVLFITEIIACYALATWAVWELWLK
jgi:hypothetical protein